MDTRALNESEMSTLLAALQLWQRELCRSGLPEWADEYLLRAADHRPNR
jgi:hypothetical protein